MSEATTPLDAPSRRGRAAALLGSALGPFLGLLLVLALFTVADHVRARARNKDAAFASLATGQKILRDASQVGVAALGMTLIIIAGGIDLSAGTAIALCATVTAWFFREDHSAATAVTAGLLTGCAAGLINGSLISLLRVVPFIITLGTMTMFLGLGMILSEDTPIRAFGKAPDWILDLQSPYPVPEYLLSGELLPVPHWFGIAWGRLPIVVSTGVWLMAALALLVGILLKYTVFGRHVFALGSNESTARLCGINVPLVRIAVYTVAGLFVGVAGLFQFAILSGEGDPKAGTGKELEIIAAVVIGGGSLNGGRGSVLGTISGACIMATILHGCVTLDIPTSYQRVIVGVIIVVAVTIDQIRQRRLAG